MKHVTLALNPFEPQTWERAECEDIRDFLISRFRTYPKGARIFNKEVVAICDVTPSNDEEIERLGALEGPFFVVVCPGDPITIISLIFVAVKFVVSLLSGPAPKVPNVAIAARNQQVSAPANALADRQNQARPKSRIPDIFGEVRSTPDLLAVPYKVFKDNIEVEVSLMCIGRGAYEVDDVRDGTTLVSAIDGSSCEIYAPNTSPQHGDTPQLIIGDAITDDVLGIQQLGSVNGQTLPYPEGTAFFSVPPDVAHFKDTGTVYRIDFDSSYTIWDTDPETGDPRSTDYDVDVTQYFSVGDSLTVTTGTFGSSPTINLAGTYTISAISAQSITLSNASSINSDWDVIGASYSGTIDGGVSLAGNADSSIGPFIVDLDGQDRVICNFVALNGLYKDDGTNQTSASVDIEIEIQGVDGSDTPVGTAETFTTTVTGSAVDKDTKAITKVCIPSIGGFDFSTGRWRVIARRMTAKDTAFHGTVVDEVKWRDCYAAYPVAVSDWGNVTTVFAVTRATTNALSVKERKLNMLVTRKLPTRVSGTTFSGLTATKRADEIFANICRDTYIGNRSNAEIDYDNIYNTIADLETYFGDSDLIEFSYTFDSLDMSFEEMAQAVANAVFCQAYRQGQTIKLAPEILNDDSAILFNHRNKLPGSETRNVRFGRQNNNDGVNLNWVDPDGDAASTIYIPLDQSAQKPITVDTIGVRNEKQATIHAWRAYQKLLYQYVTTQFTATGEANLVMRSNRVLVADNTRDDTLDGEVLAQNVLQLSLSQPTGIVGTPNHTIFLQLYDGSVQAIEIASVDTTDSRIITLADPPTLPLVTDDEAATKTVYWIAEAGDDDAGAFLVDSKEANDDGTHQLTCFNYDARYYAHDKDYA